MSHYPLSLYVEGENETLPEWHQAFEIAAAQTSGLANLFSLIKQCEHPFIDQQLVVTELAVTQYLSNKQPMLNKDLTQFMQSFRGTQRQFSEKYLFGRRFEV